MNIYAIVEDSGIPVESKELHDKVSRLPPSASLLDINPAGPVESKPLHEKVKLLLIFGQGCTGFKTLLKHYHATDSKVKIRPNHNSVDTDRPAPEKLSSIQNGKSCFLVDHLKSEKVIIKDISRERSADKSGQTHTYLVLFFLPINVEPTFKFKHVHCVHSGDLG